MADESVTNGAGEPHVPKVAITESFIEYLWNESSLPVGVRNRLKHVDRAIHGMNTIQAMLYADMLGKEDAATNNGVSFDGLTVANIEGLQLAMVALGEVAADALGDIRDNAYDCTQKQRAQESEWVEIPVVGPAQ